MADVSRAFSWAQLQRTIARREKAIEIGDRAALLIIDSQIDAWYRRWGSVARM